MEKKLVIICIAVGISLTLTTSSFAGPTLYLDADTLATGIYTASSPLVFSTTFGNVSFVGQILTLPSGGIGDQDFWDAGASGNVFDVPGNHWAELSFSIDVDSVEFIYGGNKQVITIEARDASNTVLDSLVQAPTGIGDPAGPVTLYGPGIRSLYWVDVDMGESGISYDFAALDNITLTIPAPGAILLGSIGVGLVGWLRRRRTL
jgi:hypothetical protein